MPQHLFQQQDGIPAPPAGISVAGKALKATWERWEGREAEAGGEEQAAGETSREGGGCIKIPINSLGSQEGWVSWYNPTGKC